MAVFSAIRQQALRRIEKQAESYSQDLLSLGHWGEAVA